MKRTILLCIAVLLAGCASVQQAVSGYESAAAVSIDAANDNVVKVWRYQVCQTPLAALLRNPDVIPAARALCVPTSAPGALLDPLPAAGAK